MCIWIPNANLPAPTSSWGTPLLDTWTPVKCVCVYGGGGGPWYLSLGPTQTSFSSCSLTLSHQKSAVGFVRGLFVVFLSHPTLGLYVCFSEIAVTKDHKLGGLKQQELTLSQSWRSEVRDGGAYRVGSFWGTLFWLLAGAVPGSSLACCCLTSSPQGPLPTGLCPDVLLIKTPIIGLSHTPAQHDVILTNHICKKMLLLTKVTFRGSRWTHIIWGDTPIHGSPHLFLVPIPHLLGDLSGQRDLMRCHPRGDV